MQERYQRQRWRFYSHAQTQSVRVYPTKRGGQDRLHPAITERDLYLHAVGNRIPDYASLDLTQFLKI